MSGARRQCRAGEVATGGVAYLPRVHFRWRAV